MAAHRDAPDDLGRALRALRLVTDLGGLDVAREVAQAFVRLHDGDERAGAAVLAFARQAPLLVFEPGEPLTEEGDIDARVFVVMEGEVSVQRMGPGEIARLGPGGTAGEVAGIAGTARTASVAARVRTLALCMPERALAELQAHFPGCRDLLVRAARERVLAQLLPLSSPFAELPAPEREALFDHLSSRTVPAGTCVMHAGMPTTGIYLVAAGRAQAGETELGPGDLFGESSHLFDRPAGADVVATTALTVFVLPANALQLVMVAHPRVAARLIELGRRRLGTEGETAALVAWLQPEVPPDATPEVTAPRDSLSLCRPGRPPVAAQTRR